MQTIQIKQTRVIFLVQDTLSFVCLILFFTSQSTIFQLCQDRSCWVEPVPSIGLMCLDQGHNPVKLVRLEPATPRSQDKHSTTKPLLSHGHIVSLCLTNVRNFIQIAFTLFHLARPGTKLHLSMF